VEFFISNKGIYYKLGITTEKKVKNQYINTVSEK
jgi:hypothetical protein